MKCKMCGSENLEMVVDLGIQGLSGIFPKKNESDPPKALLQLVFCNDCNLVQLGHTISPSQLYGDTYGYRSGVNRTMTEHLQEIVANIETKIKLTDYDIVLDIGSNDATLLNSYKKSHIHKIGIDPSGEKYREYYSWGNTLVSDFFSKELFLKTSKGEKADVITSIAMLYDLEDPCQFVSDIKDILYAGGIWVTEQSYMPFMIKDVMFDTICHEHLEYYTLTQLVKLFKEHGLRIFDFSFNDINGGSIQLWVCHENNTVYPKIDLRIKEVMDIEEAHGYNTKKPFVEFNEKIEKLKTRVFDFIEKEYFFQNKTIHILGASTKGNVLLQYFGIDNAMIDMAADRNPEKWGRITPVTHIPIVSEEYSRALKPDYYLVLPYHFKKEIVKREKKFLDNGGGLIFPLPKFEIVKRC